MIPGGLDGDRIMRIAWLPGDDTLTGTCHCGATHQEQEPVAMWDWLLAHPVGHEHAPSREVPAPPRLAVMV